jgi:hypothetical protein
LGISKIRNSKSKRLNKELGRLMFSESDLFRLYRLYNGLAAAKTDARAFNVATFWGE